MSKKTVDVIFLYGAVVLVTFAVVYAAFGAAVYFMTPEEEQDPVVQADTKEPPVVSQEPDQPVEKDEIISGPFSYADTELVYDKDAPVYVTVYSHNEDSWSYKVSTEDKYDKYRLGLIDRAELLASYGVEWNWQTDQPVIEAMIEYEDDPARRERTEGVNVLKYLSTLGVHFDPHAHKNNYADIAYLMEKELGVEATNVIGGTIHVECGNEHLGFLDFDSWMENVEIMSDGYVHGKDYPEALWKPEILSDPGMGGHYFDDWHSGVWKPGDDDDFYSHFPSSDIVYIGEGYPHDNLLVGRYQASGSSIFANEGQYLKELTHMIDSGVLPTGTKDGKRFMYTASIHVRDTTVIEESEEGIVTLEGLEVLMDELMPMEESGKIIFVDFEEAARIWEEEYESIPWKQNLTDHSFYSLVHDQAETYCKSNEPTR
jgi:hypothetical protein